ncbi:unnamed protein product [Ceutorhynchus assimilis]|uniref:Protein lava lamp n=1 Tax=Ceutorhynchus assimilis TaxID=467358 RepID=A0A9N9QNI8_9CUCU|nr:unnamed protein product [Ceutorhynchus assimilis]
MWEDQQNPDPGGTGKGPSPQQLTQLKDQNEQQLVLIAQLKEMLRKEQSTVSHDKVQEYVNSLPRAKKSKQNKNESSASTSTSTTKRVDLVRQQLEENKARLAERGKSHKGIEEMVTQFQAQIKDSELQTPTSASSVDIKSYSESTSQKELYNILLTKEKRITELMNENQQLEASVMDLQENLKEKDSVIDARTKAITLMMDSLSKKGKNTLDTLDETKEQMRKMQEHFIKLEAEMKARQLGLLNDLKMKNFEISELQETCNRLESELQQKPCPPTYNKTEEFENSAYTLKISQLESQLQQAIESEKINLIKIADLESQLEETKSVLASPSKIQQELEDALTELKLLKNTGMGGSANKNPAENEITKLKKQLEESNKSMIKVRAIQKGKIKELNKKLDQFRKMNDANALIAQLQNDNAKLNEKIAELEDEKGNLQLKMVDSTTSSKDDFPEIEEELKRLKEKLAEAEQELTEKNKLIEAVNEEMLKLKNDLQQKNEETIKISTQVSTEMSSIYYEEQIETLEIDKKKLLDQLNTSNLEKEIILQELDNLKKEKQDLNTKLDFYIQENMDLIDKLEKLSAEKLSSAESIEMVEGLTQQEKLELAAYQKHINPEGSLGKCADDEGADPPAELNESVLQLSEDTAELLQKIEMFTQERKEVMVKMEGLKEENNMLNLKIKEIENNRDILEETYEQLQNEKEQLQLNTTEKITKEEESVRVLDAALKELQIKYQCLIQENDELKRSLKEFDAINQEKYDLERRLKDLVENNATLDTKLNSNLDEINEYQLTIEDNKTDLLSSADTIHKLEKQLEERENDIQELHISISELNSVISELQGKQNNFEAMESELTDLKGALTQASDYESEIAQNSDIIKQLNDELITVNRKIFELENQLELKEEIIKNLQKNIAEKDQSFKIVSEDIKGKYLQLQQQLEGNEESLRKQIADLSNKNKEQLEKMKKLAANLKKKTQAYQELEEQLRIIKEENINKKGQSKLHESLQQEMSASLHEEFDGDFSKQTNADDKVRELELLLETNEATLSHYKERIEKFEEDLRQLEKAKFDLEVVNVDLIEKLTSSENSIKEKAIIEEELELKLVELSILTKDFQETQLEQQNLIKKNQENEDLIKKLKIKLKKAHDKVTELKTLQSSLQDLELLNQQLKSQIASLEDNQRHIQQENESLQKQNLSDYEKIEADYQIQLEDLFKIKNELTNDNEKLLERIKEFEEREQEFTMDFEDYKVKMEQSNSEELKLLREEFDSERRALKSEIEELESERQKLRVQIEEFNNEMSELNVNLEALQQQNSELCAANKHLEEVSSEFKKSSEDLLQENDQLKQEIQALEFAKTSLEASCDSSTKPAEFDGVLPESAANSGQKSLNLILQSNDEFEDVRNQLRVTQQEVNALKQANEKLQEEIDGLQFAKDSLEASYDSSTKPAEAQTSANFQWTEANSDSSQKNLSLALQVMSNDEFEGQQEVKLLKTEVEKLKEELMQTSQVAILQENELRKQLRLLEEKTIEIEKLKEEIHVLQFAKSSLEASCESSQKPSDSVPGNQALEEFVTKEQVVKSEATEPSPVPLFNVFAEPTPTTSIFDTFGSTSDWFSQEHQMTTLENQIIPETEVGILAKMEDQIIPAQTSFDQLKTESIVEDGREALLNKIKALEFLLYSVDKEKEIALEQCTEMVNALTQLITQNSDNLEPQILSQDAVDNLASNSQRPSASISQNYGPQAVPVTEETIQPKKAYLCFTDEVESQIMSQNDIEEASNKTLLKNLEFEQSPAVAVEPVAHSKQAYLCFTKEDKPKSLEAFEENDDGWGWGPEEARLEEEHIKTQENTPQAIEELKQIIKTLELERHGHLEEIKQLQIKSGKLIKKYKELKAQGKKSDEFDLNETIQEELKSQVQQLEKRIKELTNEHEKDKSEKQNLLKRVDVLTAANDRMTEMKEIQDSEVLRWQRKHQEAVQKLQESDWGFASEQPQPKTSNDVSDPNKIKELEDNLRELALDNEELQALLEEQTAKRIEAEKNKYSEEMKTVNESLNKELNEAKVKLDELKDSENEISILQLQISNHQEQLQERDFIINDLQSNLEQLMNRKSELDQQLTSADLKIKQLIEEAEQVKKEKSFIEISLSEAQNKLQIIEGVFNKANSDNEELNLNYARVLQELQGKIIEVEQNQMLINELQVKIQEIETMNVEKSSLIDQLQVKLQEQANRSDLEKEIEILKSEKLEKDLEIQNKEQEFQKIINDLNENWQLQVDQRGNDVAESWRMHLEMVEKDYSVNQEKLKSDLLEFEEKCNLLVNENNELRKNVDQEIRNEVDKMSALQQQISTLRQTIVEKDKQIEEIQNTLSNYLSEMESLRFENSEKDNKLSSINIIIETTQRQFDEKREVVEAIVSVLEKQAPSPISYEKADILEEFNRQLTFNNSGISKLNETIQELSRTNGEKEREITGLNQIIEDLEKDLSIVHEKEAEIVRLTNELELIHQENNHLQQEFNKLKQEHNNCSKTIEDANKKLQDYNNSQTSLQYVLDEKHKEINDLNQQLLELSTRNDSNKEVESLNSTLAAMKEDYLALQSSFSECQNQLYETTQQLSQNTQQLQNKTDHIGQYEQNMAYYDQEINRLKNLLELREKEYHDSLELLKNNQLADLQTHYNELLSNKDIDNNTLKAQVQELITANQNYSEKLNEEVCLKQQFEMQLSQQTQLVNEDTRQLEELKSIIEEQASKIDQLEKELFDKSNQYDSLIAEMDMGRAPVTRQPAAKPKPDESLSEPELDLALYMLHQRDVRCEELTVELTQLLEERDTLQLRLSNAIREKEELRRAGLVGDDESSRNLETNQSELLDAKNPLDNEENLASKLFELKNVGYKKDKTFVDEQEARRFQQLAIMQQHINDASKLPPEAAAKLVDASYTLSRDVQSPSKVLLNWLWGKNPPKANDS